MVRHSSTLTSASDARWTAITIYQNDKVVDGIAARGKIDGDLREIYGHGDHFFGVTQSTTNFEGTIDGNSAKVIAAHDRTGPQRRSYADWKRRFQDKIDSTLVVADDEVVLWSGR